MRGDLGLRIGRTAAAHADVLAHGIIILQDESRLIIELLRRDLFQILPARLRNTVEPQPSDSPKQQIQPAAGRFHIVPFLCRRTRQSSQHRRSIPLPAAESSPRTAAGT